MALQSLLAKENADNSAAGDSKPQSSTSTGPKQPMLAPKAKRVIYLHMAGSPSQLELFEHKPDLDKLHMQDCPASFLEGKRFAFIKGIPKFWQASFRFVNMVKVDSGSASCCRILHLCPTTPASSVQFRRINSITRRRNCSFTPVRLDWEIRRLVRGSIMDLAASTKIFRALLSCCPVVKLPTPENRFGDQDFCHRFIRAYNVAQSAILYCI